MDLYNNFFFQYHISFKYSNWFYNNFSRVVCSFAASILCSRIPGLSNIQRQLCIESPDAMAALGAGHKLGAQECQHQFKGTHHLTIFFILKVINE